MAATPQQREIRSLKLCDRDEMQQQTGRLMPPPNILWTASSNERMRVVVSHQCSTQVLICAKSPLAVMLVIVNEAVPVLLNVTACAALVVPTFWLANVRLVGDKPATGAMPVPLRLAVCGLPAALSLTVRVPAVPAWFDIDDGLIRSLPAHPGRRFRCHSRRFALNRRTALPSGLPRLSATHSVPRILLRAVEAGTQCRIKSLIQSHRTRSKPIFRTFTLCHAGTSSSRSWLCLLIFHAASLAYIEQAATSDN